MKIGLCMDTILESDAGVQQSIKGLARYLLKKGQDVKFVVPSMLPESSESREFADRIIPVGKTIKTSVTETTVPLALHYPTARVKQILDEEKFDLVHVSVPASPFSGEKLIRYAQCPVVVTYMIQTRNRLHQLGLGFVQKCLSRVYKKVDGFIAPSEAAKRDAEVVFPGDYELIPHGVDVSDYSHAVEPFKRFRDGKLNVFFVGRLEERKGADYLVRAFCRVVNEKGLGNCRLIVAGDGPMRQELEKLATVVDPGSGSEVVFEGYIDELDKPRYYASADLCVFPAIYGECFGIVLVEAMASGKATVVFNNEGYGWVMRNMPELIVENMNEDALVEKISELLSDGELREWLAEKCLQEAQNYTWDAVGARIVEMYKKVLSR